MLRQPPRAAVFDLDGTLVHTEPRNRLLWARLFERHAVPYDDAVLASFAGRRGWEVLAEYLHLFPGRTVDELYRQAVEFESSPEWPPAEAVPGAVELVRMLRREGVPRALVTSGSRPYATALLEEVGLDGALDVLVTADDVRVGKPDPEGYRAACARLGVPPEQAVAFEDAPAGVAAAKAAGLPVVGLTTTVTAELLAAADRLVPDLKQVSWPDVFGS